MPWFSSYARREKLYQKQEAILLPPLLLAGRVEKRTQATSQKGRATVMTPFFDPELSSIQQQVDYLLLARYAPASVLVTETLEIVYVRGHTGCYLEPAPGRASLQLLKMVRHDLLLPVRRALQQAAKEQRALTVEENPLLIDGQECEVTIEVVPMQEEQGALFYLVLFSHTRRAVPDASGPQQAASLLNGMQDATNDQQIETLEHELLFRSEEVLKLMEEQTAFREELQTSNEELLASNEEMQSINEELEVSREELQTKNEELDLVNRDLSAQHRQTLAAQQYTDAIVSTVRDPLIILDGEGYVQRVNAAFVRTFQVPASEAEGHLLLELGNRQWDIPALQHLLERVFTHREAFEDFTVEHLFPSIGHRVMQLNARPILADGDRPVLGLLAIEDITFRHALEIERAERATSARFQAAIGQALAEQLALPDMLHACAQAMVTHLGAAKGCIWTLNESQQVLELQASVGLSADLDEEYLQISMGAFKIGRVAQTRQPYLSNTVQGDPQIVNQDWAEREGIVAFAGYPLLLGEQMLGVIALFARHPLQETVLDALSASGASIALGIERIRMHEALAASEERLHLWIEQASDVLTLMTRTGKVLSQSPSVERLLGWTVQDFQGINLLQGTWLHPQDRLLMEEFLQELELHPAETVTTIVRMAHRDGTWYPMEMRGRNLIAHPLIRALVVLSRDVSERLEVEQQKEAFFGMISHELRTPLTAVKGNLQLIQRQLKQVLAQPEEPVTQAGYRAVELSERLAQRALHQVNLQNRLIQDLLDLSRLQSQQLDLQMYPCQLATLVQEIVQDIQASAPDRLIEIEMPASGPLPVLADPQRIGQVLTNYLTNALKYTPESTPIVVGLTQEESQIRVWVRDQGEGLSAEQQQRIWQQFYQVPGKQERSGFGMGLGLGLYICQMLIHAHGGELGVESRQEEGATFWFTLPLLAEKQIALLTENLQDSDEK